MKTLALLNPVLFSVVFIASCSPVHKPNLGAEKGSQLTSLDVGFPDPATISQEAPKLLTHIRFSLKEQVCDTQGNQCRIDNVLDKVLAYKTGFKFDEIKLIQGRRYNLAIAIGQALATNQEELDPAKTFYITRGIDGEIPPESFLGKDVLKKTFYLELTKAGVETRMLPETKRPPESENLQQNTLPPMTQLPPNPTPTPTVPQNQNPTITPLSAALASIPFESASNPKNVVGDVFKGQYLFVTYSMESCPPCKALLSSISKPENLSKIKSIEAKGRCKFATAVLGNYAPILRLQHPGFAQNIFGMPVSTESMMGSFFKQNVSRFPTMLVFDRTGKVEFSSQNSGVNYTIFESNMNKMCL